MVVAHSQGENHKVLDTMESLAMLRLEGVLMLRHYTILDTMHTSLTDIYRRFMLQVSFEDETQTRLQLFVVSCFIRLWKKSSYNVQRDKGSTEQ